jgi:hypothetical protein
VKPLPRAGPDSVCDRTATQARAQQLLPADDVVLMARDPRNRPLHVMHNLSLERRRADRGRFRITHMHPMAGSWFSGSIGRFRM